MNKKILFYIGLILLVTPFLGIYTFMKNLVYITIALILIISSYSKSNARKKETNLVSDNKTKPRVILKEVENKDVVN